MLNAECLSLAFLVLPARLLQGGDPGPTIEMFRSAFLPASVSVEPGAKVTWLYRAGSHILASGLPDAAPGTADEPGRLFDAPVDETHPSFAWIVPDDASATIPFFCRSHPEQAGFLEIATGEETFRVAVVDNMFNPDEISIFAGDTVRWEHEPGEGFHTVTSGLSSKPEDDPGALFDAESSDGNPVFAYRFAGTGDFPYFCRPHEHMGMKGVVRVQRKFLRGDANADGLVDLSDAIGVLFVLFEGAGEPPCPDALDADDDGILGMADASAILEHLFLGGPPPPRPYPRPGADRTEDGLRCR
jgi:plastocyanin